MLQYVTERGNVMTKLPPRTKRMPTKCEHENIIKKEYSYSDIVNNNIKVEEIAYITIGKNDITYNLDLLKSILSQNKNIEIKFWDWESVCYIDSNIPNIIENSCYLIDDGLRMSREYIDLSKLLNIKLIIPLNYLMWGIKFNEYIDTYCFQYEALKANYLSFASANGNKRLSKENLEKIRKKIVELNSNGALNDSEKVALISDFIQSRTQYIDSRESESIRGTFITPNFPANNMKSGLVEEVFNEQNGLCMGIANLSTLLLNNPEFNVEVESLTGCSHAWNRVLIDGKYYYFDNTWNITRSDNPCSYGLITLSFSNKYNLFGKQTALNIGHHIAENVPVYNNGVLSEEDYQKIQYESRFEYLLKPVYKSFKK